MDQLNNRLFYSPEEFRKILPCSRGVCYEALRQHKIRSFRLGRKYFIPASEVERLSQLAAAETERTTKVDGDLW